MVAGLAPFLLFLFHEFHVFVGLESLGWEEDLCSEVNGGEETHDGTITMEEWDRDADAVLLTKPKSLPNQVTIVHDVVVREHDSFRLSRRTLRIQSYVFTNYNISQIQMYS